MPTAMKEILMLVTSIVGKANPAWFDTDEFDAWQNKVIGDAEIIIKTWDNDATYADEALDRIEQLFTKVVHY